MNDMSLEGFYASNASLFWRFRLRKLCAKIENKVKTINGIKTQRSILLTRLC